MNMNELTERVQLALAILRNQDTALTKHVRREIELVDGSVALNCTNIARVFALEGHSGGSASIVIPWIQKALSGEPIVPLTGEDTEWNDVSEMSGYPLWQNKRCARVFKDADGESCDVQGRVFRESNGGGCYTNGDSRMPVVFPYLPTTQYVEVTPNAVLTGTQGP